MTSDLERRAWRRAQDRCEYCRLPPEGSRLTFPIDHVTAKQHGGRTEFDNLALSCPHCNRYKGPNIAGLNPIDGSLTRLFNPRRDRWDDHFSWDGLALVGLTAVGRATVQVLAINAPVMIAIREELAEDG